MKLIFINGSRGEWGYIKPIIDLCRQKSIKYSICATNMLLLPAHGNLLKEIIDSGYNVSDQIYMSLEGHNHLSMVKSLSIFMASFTDTLAREKPDWIVCAGIEVNNLWPLFVVHIHIHQLLIFKLESVLEY